MIYFIFAIIILIIFLFVFAQIQYERHYEPEHAHEQHRVQTQDGVHISLWRHPPKIATTQGEPVLLVHGLGSNHRNHNFSHDYGVAQYLAEKGYDCWCIDLRGSGQSKVKSKKWVFDDHVNQDLPAAIAYILEQTNKTKIHWVGHSMGGMLYYALAGTKGYSSSIASAVILGSPVRFYRPTIVEQVAHRFGRYIGWIPLLPAPIIARVITLLFNIMPSRLLYIQFNYHNMDRALIRRLATTAVSKISIHILLQFARWIVEHRWESLDRKVDYQANLNNVTSPTLIVAGAADRLCPPYTVKFAYAQIAAQEKCYLEAGVASGMSCDYGHVDMIFGRHAPQEIYPEIYAWLQKYPFATML